ncbi:glycosyltransferase family 2 protein [Brasilonema sp. UFV-L1]|uniref:glycosyltransferase family 2 protein n=1 Tax=Brasilonema sp. UFV-L1 TaxID=2234130 RepID=UPI00145C8A55|nr:glycosyltransferase family 2 protein [Brasilonema sp. UFV-L1]NMG06926.1 glycosyltransferase family 2 protein [Brasilonema sp. UFV-L1]
MTNLLTIAIPTYNRAQLLDNQLAWLFRAIKGFESVCEIIVSDNCSTDDTPKVVEKWQSIFSNTTFNYKRNPENIGAVRNIASCIKAANSKYVWTISDDDKIFDNSIAYIVNTLTQHSNLGLIILNFSKSNAKTGEVFEQRCFDVEHDEVSSNGKAVFERCLEQSTGGVGLTTALVYRTDLAQRAIDNWVEGLSNLAVQIYWTAFCAYHGDTLVTKDNYLECVAGTHYFMQNPKLLVTLEYADIPEIMVKLRDIGYPNDFSRKMLYICLKKFNWRVLLGAFRRWPLVAVKAFSRYVSYAYS